MRDAKVSDLKSGTIPVLIARVPERELTEWFPVRMRKIPNPTEVPEPCRAALVQLDGGQCCLLSYGEISRELRLWLPETANLRKFMGALFKEVPQLRERILWQRKHVRPRDAGWRRRS